MNGNPMQLPGITGLVLMDGTGMGGRGRPPLQGQKPRAGVPAPHRVSVAPQSKAAGRSARATPGVRC
ncbi:MAG TPA: hypothetical protein VF447_03685, partial [Terriglobales bacterium]